MLYWVSHLTTEYLRLNSYWTNGEGKCGNMLIYEAIYVKLSCCSYDTEDGDDNKDDDDDDDEFCPK